MRAQPGDGVPKTRSLEQNQWLIAMNILPVGLIGQKEKQKEIGHGYKSLVGALVGPCRS